MGTKQVKGIITLAFSLALILNACGTKKPTTAATPVPVPTKAAIQSIDPKTLDLDGTGTKTAPADDSGDGTEEDTTTTTSASPGASTAPSTAASTASSPAASVAASGTPAPTATDSASASPSATATATPTPTPTPTPTATDSASATPTPTPTPTPSPTPTPVPTPTPIPVGNELRTSIGDGKLNKPGGIDVRNGKIYVSNLGKAGFTCAYVSKGQVQVFDTAGNLASTIEGSCGDNLPTDLTGVATDGSRVWVTNKVPYSGSKQNLYSYITDGTNRQNSTIGLSSGSNLKDMAINSSAGYLYIADGYTNSVNRVSYNATGTTNQEIYFISQVNPSGITLDDLGNIWLVNNVNNNPIIIKYGKTTPPAPDTSFTTQGINGTGPSGITQVGDIAYDPRLGGIIYVAAQVNGKMVILRYDSKGNFIRYFGEDAAMVNPVGMAVGMDGTLYVLDQGKNNIQQFGPGL